MTQKELLDDVDFDQKWHKSLEISGNSFDEVRLLTHDDLAEDLSFDRLLTDTAKFMPHVFPSVHVSHTSSGVRTSQVYGRKPMAAAMKSDVGKETSLVLRGAELA